MSTDSKRAQEATLSARPSDPRLREAQRLHHEERRLERQATEAARSRLQARDELVELDFQKTAQQAVADRVEMSVRLSKQHLDEERAQLAAKEQEVAAATDPARAADLREEAAQLRTDVAEREAQVERLEAELGETRSELKQTNERMEARTADVERFTAEAARLRTQAEEREAAAEALEAQRAAEPARPDVPEIEIFAPEELRQALREGHSVVLQENGHIRISEEKGEPMSDDAIAFLEAKLPELRHRMGEGWSFQIEPDGSIAGGGPWQANYFVSPDGKVAGETLAVVRSRLADGYDVSVGPDGTIVTSRPAREVTTEQAQQNLEAFDREVASGRLAESLEQGRGYDLNPDGSGGYSDPEPLTAPVTAMPTPEFQSDGSVTQPEIERIELSGPDGEAAAARAQADAMKERIRTRAEEVRSVEKAADAKQEELAELQIWKDRATGVRTTSEAEVKAAEAKVRELEEQVHQAEAGGDTARAEALRAEITTQQAKAEHAAEFVQQAVAREADLTAKMEAGHVEYTDLRSQSKAGWEELKKYQDTGEVLDDRADALGDAARLRAEHEALKQEADGLAEEAAEHAQRFRENAEQQGEAYRQSEAAEAKAEAIKGERKLGERESRELEQQIKQADKAGDTSLSQQLKDELKWRQERLTKLDAEQAQATQEAATYKAESDRLHNLAGPLQDHARTLAQQAQVKSKQANDRQMEAQRAQDRAAALTPDPAVLQSAGITEVPAPAEPEPDADEGQSGPDDLEPAADVTVGDEFDSTAAADFDGEGTTDVEPEVAFTDELSSDGESSFEPEPVAESDAGTEPLPAEADQEPAFEEPAFEEPAFEEPAFVEPDPAPVAEPEPADMEITNEGFTDPMA